MSFIFLLNGDFDKEYDINFFKNYNYIICIDGGYEKFLKLNLNIEPDYLIGDFDSIANMNEKTKNLPKNKIIFKDNQDESDTEFALKYILNKYTKEKISNTDFIYATSTSRIDHMLCNMLLLKQVPLNIESKIITKTQEIFLVRNKVEIKGHANRTLSVIPITNVKGLTIKGCKWELDNVDLNFGFIGGISNIVEKDPSEISVKEGECIIVISYEI
jgi:thiamine pyrophosphokinase